MKELKFQCPSCGQHIQCDLSHAGENVPCPSCAVMIRVPKGGELADVEDPVESAAPFAPADDSKKVSYAVTDEEGHILNKKPSFDPETHQAPTAVPTLEKKPMADAKAELHCVCPVCKSELRLSIEAMPATGESHVSDAKPKEKTAKVTELAGRQPPTGDREQQLAALREAHSVSAYPALKPRLDKILGDEGDKKAA